MSPTTTRPHAAAPAPAEWLAMAGLACVGVAVAASPAAVEGGPVICPFRILTGLPCPGCGLTRSWVHGVHGHWADAWAANPFGIVTLAFVIALAVVLVVRRVRHRPPVDLDRVVRHRFTKLVLGGWLVFAAVRLVLVL